jgi:hypothetical protein
VHGHAVRRQFRPERFAVPLRGEFRRRVTRSIRRPNCNKVDGKGATARKRSYLDEIERTTEDANDGRNRGGEGGSSVSKTRETRPPRTTHACPARNLSK